MIEAQDDKFTKRFIFWLAMGISAAVLAFDFCFFFVDFPEKNRDIINNLTGTLNSGGLIMIWSYFFGSSSSSFTKNQTIKNLTDEKIQA